MARSQTGLRNRYRPNGKSSYTQKRRTERDDYGTWTNGTCTRTEVIDGHALTRTRINTTLQRVQEDLHKMRYAELKAAKKARGIIVADVLS